MKDWNLFEETAREQSRTDPAGFRKRVYRRGGSAVAQFYFSFFLLTTWPLWMYLIWRLLGHVKAVDVFMAAFIAVTVLMLVLIVYWTRFVRAMFVRNETEEGLNLPDGADKIIRSDLDELCMKTGAKQIDKIVIKMHASSEVTTSRAVRLFGPWRRVLSLGFYQLGMLTREEYRVVLAHVLPHVENFAGAEARLGYAFALWSRLRAICEEVSQHHNPQNVVPDPLRSWAKRVEQELATLIGILREQRLFEADVRTAGIFGTEEFARTFMKWAVARGAGNRRFERWSSEVARTHVRPVNDFVERALKCYSDPVSPEELQTQIEELKVLNDPKAHAETVPFRLSKLGVSLDDVLRPEHLEATATTPSALHAYFPEDHRAFAVFYSHAHRQNTREWYFERATRRARAEAALASLDEDLKSGELLPREHALQKFENTAIVHGGETALALVPELIAAHPEDPNVMLAIGRTCLEEQHEVGLEYLRSVMRLHPRIAVRPVRLMVSFLNGRGRFAEKDEVLEEFRGIEHRLVAAEQERANVTMNTSFIDPKLTKYERKIMRNTLAGCGWVSRAWVATRDFKDQLNEGYHYLGIVPMPDTVRFGVQTDFNALIQRDIFSKPELWDLSVYMLIPEWNHMYLLTRFKKLSTALIFDRNPSPPKGTKKGFGARA